MYLLLGRVFRAQGPSDTRAFLERDLPGGRCPCNSACLAEPQKSECHDAGLAAGAEGFIGFHSSSAPSRAVAGVDSPLEVHPVAHLGSAA